MKKKRNKIIVFVLIMSLFMGAMFLGYYLFKETPTKALCDDMMNLMGDPIHNKMHKDYQYTMALIHQYIAKCNENGMYQSQSQNMTGMFMP